MKLAVLAAIVVGVLAACSKGDSEERLPTPFPGTILTANAIGGRCEADGCNIDYRVRIANPTDTDALVVKCNVVSGAPLRVLWVGVPSGLGIDAHATTTSHIATTLHIERDEARQLIGERLLCSGFEVNGERPI